MCVRFVIVLRRPIIASRYLQCGVESSGVCCYRECCHVKFSCPGGRATCLHPNVTLERASSSLLCSSFFILNGVHLKLHVLQVRVNFARRRAEARERGGLPQLTPVESCAPDSGSGLRCEFEESRCLRVSSRDTVLGVMLYDILGTLSFPLGRGGDTKLPIFVVHSSCQQS